MYWGIVDYIFNSEVSKTDSELFLEAEIVPIGFYSSLALIGAFLLFPLLFCIGMYSSHALCWLLEWQQLRLSLKKLEIKVLSKGSLGQLRDSICSICRDEYEAGDRVRILCCHHEFHAFCVDRWLSGQVKSCPLCNSRVHVGGMVQDEKLKEGAFVRFFQF
ncbi:hypothetical protein BDR26DRAFT_851078 [Obelidium mucronatum]|nr:hypothetical protein BDR26DRAFT_851078 [Obelidium mucronatum]